MDNLHDTQIGDYIFVTRLPCIGNSTMILVRCVHCDREKEVRRYDFLRGKNNCPCQTNSRSITAKKAFAATAVYKCNECGADSWRGSQIILDIDHIVPIKMGGIDSVDNMQYLCPNCHRVKTAKEFEW